PRPACSTLFPYTTLFRSRNTHLLDRRAHRRALRLVRNAALLVLANSLDGGFLVGHGTFLSVVNLGRPASTLPQRAGRLPSPSPPDRKSTRLNSSHVKISY